MASGGLSRHLPAARKELRPVEASSPDATRREHFTTNEKVGQEIVLEILDLILLIVSSLATRRTERNDCNLDAHAGFAGAQR